MGLILWLAVFIGTIYLMIKTKKQVVDGQISQEMLTGNEKLLVWLFCFLNPIIAGAVFYYGWKKNLPMKAKAANQISLWAFLILVIFWGLASSQGWIEI